VKVRKEIEIFMISEKRYEELRQMGMSSTCGGVGRVKQLSFIGI
jgi:hypothetical protein